MARLLTSALTAARSDIVFGVALSSSGDTLALAGASKDVRLFDVRTGAELFHTRASDRVRAVALNADAAVIAYGAYGGQVRSRTRHLMPPHLIPAVISWHMTAGSTGRCERHVL